MIRRFPSPLKAGLRIAGLFLLFLLLSCGDRPRTGPSAGADPTLPTGYFILNKGQVANPEVLLYHVSGSLQAGFSESGVLLRLTKQQPEKAPPGEMGPGGPAADPVDGVALRLSFPGSRSVKPVGRDPMPFRTHFLIGADREKWRTDCPAFGEIVYPNLYEGIDLAYRLGDEGLK